MTDVHLTRKEWKALNLSKEDLQYYCKKCHIDDPGSKAEVLARLRQDEGIFKKLRHSELLSLCKFHDIDTTGCNKDELQQRLVKLREAKNEWQVVTGSDTRKEGEPETKKTKQKDAGAKGGKKKKDSAEGGKTQNKHTADDKQIGKKTQNKQTADNKQIGKKTVNKQTADNKQTGKKKKSSKDSPTKQSLSKSEREQVFRRFFDPAPSGKCPVCKKVELTIDRFQAAHIVSTAEGGPAVLTNMIPSCPCNQSMGSMHLFDWMGSCHYNRNLLSLAARLWDISTPKLTRERQVESGGVRNVLVEFVRRTYGPPRLREYQDWLMASAADLPP